ncbi:MAG TPA: hypothetical protein VLX92_21705 [Kofleriaceae bacterium]|nr:hypothetical protein [Kofleriaceae bacterium]
MKTPVVMIMLLLGGSALAESRLEPSGAAENEALRGNVLVWSDATFYTEPSDAGQALHVAKLAATRKDSVGEVVPMHVVSAGKDFVEVELASERDCTWSRLETTDDLARVRLFVRRADLAPVLAAPFATTFPDGTSIALRPGVALVPTAENTYVIAMRGAEIAVALPASAVGHAYVPDRAKPVTSLDEREYELQPHTPVKLAGRTFQLAGRAGSIERRGDTTLFAMHAGCVALEVAAPSKAVREVEADDDDGDDASGLGVLDLRDHDYIPAGTMLSSAGGHTIAVAARPIYLMGRPHGKTACVERRMRVAVAGGEALDPDGDEPKLRLCVASSAVVHERMRSASSASGTTSR